MKTETVDKEIEIVITGLHSIRTPGAVPLEAQIEVVLEYKEAKQTKDSDEPEG